MKTYNTIGFAMISAMILMPLVALGCCGGSSDLDALVDEAVAEGNGESTGALYKSCNDAGSISQCSEYTKKAMSLLGEDFYKSICDLTEGTWSGDSCPTANLVGKCDDGEGTITLYYSDGGSPYDEKTAKKDCGELMGKFVQ